LPSAGAILFRLYVALHLCGLAALPVLALAPRPRSWAGFGVALAIMVGGAAYWFMGSRLDIAGGLYPYTAGVLGPWGAYSPDLVVGGAVPLFSSDVRLLLTVLGCVGAAGLLTRLGERLARILDSPLLLLSLFQLALLLAAPALHDRYVVFLLPGALWLAANGEPASRGLWLPGLGLLLLMAVLAVALEHDGLAWNAVRWSLGRRALARDVAAGDIEGGFEWNGWFSPPSRAAGGHGGPRGFRMPFTAAFFPDCTGRLALAFSVPAGAVVLASETYSSWLRPGSHRFFLIAQPGDEEAKRW
jgi:hypothetical protein